MRAMDWWLTELYRSKEPTEMKVPGKKNNVTSVMIFIDTVSLFVLRAISPISLVRCSMFFVDFCDCSASCLLASVLWYSRSPFS